MRSAILASTATALGVLLLLAPSVAGAAITETVLLHENPLHIAPERILASQGDEIQLDVRNPETNGAPHSFTIPGFGKTIDRLEPGQSLRLVFLADKAGEFEYSCMFPGHKQSGMRGVLQVQGEPGKEKEAPGPSLLVLGGAALATVLLLAIRRPRRDAP